LDRWPRLDVTVGLLLFAQRVEECLFDYTLDTYKAPALNAHSRLNELLDAVRDVRHGAMPLKTLEPLLQELAWSLAGDRAAQQLIGAHYARFSRFDAWDRSSLDAIETQAKLLQGFFAARNYESALVGTIKECLADPKQKELLVAATANLVVEWTNRGFSRDYVFAKTRGFFFGVGLPPIEDLGEFDRFLEYFNGKRSTFQVCFRASASFRTLKDIAPEEVATISLTAPAPKSTLSKERMFLTEAHQGVWITIPKVLARDPRAAGRSAVQQMDLLSNIARYHVHRVPFQWDGRVLVYDESGTPWVLRPSLMPTLKGQECPLRDLPARFLDTLMSLRADLLPDESWHRIAAALDLHASALSATVVETQLSNLWSALEALLPLAGAESRIARIIQIVIPVLARKYPLKLIRNLHEDLTTCVPGAYETVLGKVGSGADDLERCAALVCIPDHEPLRDELYVACERNPLLRNRLYTIKRTLSDAPAILSTIRAHEQRVTWHLRRIYRGRNLLVHRGLSVPFREALVESLHSYVDQIIGRVQEVFGGKPRPADLDVALYRIGVDHAAHIDLLVSSKGSTCASDNLKQLVFGEV
jgi:hypothetical protein